MRKQKLYGALYRVVRDGMGGNPLTEMSQHFHLQRLKVPHAPMGTLGSQ